MSDDQVSVFFYGLFMDAAVLARHGVRPTSTTVCRLDGYRLRIGARATLVRDGAAAVHGVLMALSRADLARLYEQPSVAGYAPRDVSVALPSGESVPALCYLLPEDQLAGTNTSYAESLFELGTSLGLPEDYLAAIRRERRAP